MAGERVRRARQMGDLTESFSAYRLGDQEAFDRIFAALYPDLTRLARARLRGGQRMTLVDTTMLVDERYWRFLHAGQIQVENRAHFFAYSARVMRSIIVDFARERQAEQRGGGWPKLPWTRSCRRCFGCRRQGRGDRASR